MHFTDGRFMIVYRHNRCFLKLYIIIIVTILRFLLLIHVFAASMFK